MYPIYIRRKALAMIAAGASLNATSKALGINRSTIREWRERGVLPRPPAHARGCPRCESGIDLDPAAYAHLLGLYLGDGYVGRLRKGVFSLRIFCADAYPGLIQEAGNAIRAVHPAAKVYFVQQAGCTAVTGLWKHWPCLFPQFGAGAKHTRRIELQPWQTDIARTNPGRFLRGLFHSDGCRIVNWTIRMVAGEPKRYEYPRYFFTNRSVDIINLCTWALDLLNIAWRIPKPGLVSVARKAAVAALDEHVGPKY